jgi:predicted DNA-binding transcriptional regulator AlpA
MTLANEKDNFELLDVGAMAEMLNSTKKSIYTWLSRKKFPKDIYIKIGRRPMFIKPRVIDWLLSGGSSEMN